jgi:hypothetical protein
VVEILCPHCSEELELDDDACGAFEWNMTTPMQVEKIGVRGPVLILST